MGLSASPEDQAKLLDVADTDLALARAHTTLKGLAAALHLDTLDAAIDEIKGRRHDAFIELESIRSELARAESDVSLVDARIAQDSQRLEHTSSAKDALGLEHELESLRTRRSNLEDIELAIMEKLEPAEAWSGGHRCGASHCRSRTARGARRRGSPQRSASLRDSCALRCRAATDCLITR